MPLLPVLNQESRWYSKLLIAGQFVLQLGWQFANYVLVGDMEDSVLKNDLRKNSTLGL